MKADQPSTSLGTGYLLSHSWVLGNHSKLNSKEHTADQQTPHVMSLGLSGILTEHACVLVCQALCWAIRNHTDLKDITKFALSLFSPLCCCLLLSLIWLLWPMDCSQPDSSVHGISQMRILEWTAVSFSRGSSRPRDWNCLLHCMWILHHRATREACFPHFYIWSVPTFTFNLFPIF